MAQENKHGKFSLRTGDFHFLMARASKCVKDEIDRLIRYRDFSEPARKEYDDTVRALLLLKLFVDDRFITVWRVFRPSTDAEASILGTFSEALTLGEKYLGRKVVIFPATPEQFHMLVSGGGKFMSGDSVGDIEAFLKFLESSQ